MDGQKGRQTPYGRIHIKGDYYICMYVYICVCVCDSIGLLRETIHMNICIILNGYRGRAV